MLSAGVSESMRVSASQSRAVAAVVVARRRLGCGQRASHPVFGAVFILAALFAGVFFIVERSLLPVRLAWDLLGGRTSTS